MAPNQKINFSNKTSIILTSICALVFVFITLGIGWVKASNGQVGSHCDSNSDCGAVLDCIYNTCLARPFSSCASSADCAGAADNLMGCFSGQCRGRHAYPCGDQRDDPICAPGFHCDISNPGFHYCEADHSPNPTPTPVPTPVPTPTSTPTPPPTPTLTPTPTPTLSPTPTVSPTPTSSPTPTPTQTPTPTLTPTPTPTNTPTPTVSPTPTPGNGGGGGTCSYWQSDCYSTATPTPEPTASTSAPVNPQTCSRTVFGENIPQTLCLITPINGGTCILAANDGFTVKINVPANAVPTESIIDLSIHNPKDYPQLGTKIGNLNLIGPKIVYAFVQDDNCNIISFSQDAIITFIYPNSYARGYLETSFILENASSPWHLLTSTRNIIANSLISAVKNLGYFGIFGRVAPLVLGAATKSPEPTPVCPILTPTPIVSMHPTDDNLLESFFVASLISRIKDIHISWSDFLSLLNFLLIIILFWLIAAKKLLAAPTGPETSVQPKAPDKKTVGQKFIAAILAIAVLFKKIWEKYQKRRILRKNAKSLSVASLLAPGEESVEANSSEIIQGPQFITFKESKD